MSAVTCWGVLLIHGDCLVLVANLRKVVRVCTCLVPTVESSTPTMFEKTLTGTGQTCQQQHKYNGAWHMSWQAWASTSNGAIAEVDGWVHNRNLCTHR